MEEQTWVINVKPRIVGLDEALDKAEQLAETINSAKSLAGELAELCKEIEVTVTAD